MERPQLKALDKTMVEIEECLDPMDVIDELIEKQIMTNDDLTALKAKGSKQDQVFLFIRILRAQKESFYSFLDTLMKHKTYKKLGNKIKTNHKQCCNDGSSVDVKEKDVGTVEGFHVSTLTMTMDELEKFLNPIDVMGKLIAKGVMNHHDMEKLEYKDSQKDKVRLFISILQRRGNTAFRSFVEALFTPTYKKELVDKIKINEQYCKKHYEKDIKDMIRHLNNSETYHRLEMLWKLAHSLTEEDIKKLTGHFPTEEWEGEVIWNSEYPQYSGMTFIKTCWARNIETMKTTSEVLHKFSSITLTNTACKIMHDYTQEMKSPEMRLNVGNLPNELVLQIKQCVLFGAAFFVKNRILNLFFREEYNVYYIDTVVMDNIVIVLRIPSARALGHLCEDIKSGVLADTVMPLLTNKDRLILSQATLNWSKESLITIQEYFGPKPLCLPGSKDCNVSSSKRDDSSNCSGNMELCQPGLDVLRTIGEDQVLVISVSGPARTGKSFFLSQLVDGITFTVGHTVDPQTKGIWVASSPDKKLHKGVKTRIVLLDAEGAGTTETDDQGVWDTKIFAICFLISSLMIYNSRNIPTKSDFETLEFVAKFSESVFEQATDRDSADDFHQWAPSFLWLFRDITVKLEKDKYKSWTEYLESRIWTDSNKPALNLVKNAIKTSFSSISATALKSPSSSEEICQDLQNPKYKSELREFEAQLESVKKLIFEKSSIRKIGGKYLTGNMLADLLENYIKEINTSSESLHKESMWELNMRVTLQYHLVLFQTNLKTMLNEITLPCPTDGLTETLSDIQKTVKDMFYKELKLKDVNRKEDINSEVQNIIDTEMSFLHDKNYVASAQFCRKCADNLLIELFNPVDLKQKSFEAITDDILRQFDCKTKGFPRTTDIRKDLINRLEYRNEGFVLLDLVASFGKQFEKVITQSFEDMDSEKAIKTRRERNLALAESELRNKSKGRSQNEQQSLLENLRHIFNDLFDRASEKWCRSVMEEITRKLKRQICHPDTSDYVSKVENLLEEYRNKARGPKVTEVKDAFKGELEDLTEKAKASYEKHVSKLGCINVMEGLVSRLQQQIENPKEADHIMKLDDLLREYRQSAQGSEVSVVEKENKVVLEKLCKEASNVHESHIACLNFINNIIKELQRIIDKPQVNDKIRAFDQYREQYRGKAFGPQMAIIEEQYEGRLKQLCDEAFSAHESHVHCVNVMKEIINKLKFLINNPDEVSSIETFDQYISSYRKKARGSEVTSVKEQYADDLKELRDKAKSTHESHVQCTREMKKLLTKLQRQCEEPQNNTNVFTLDNLLKEYHTVATGSQEWAIESKYKDKLRDWSHKASNTRCEWVISGIIKELDSQISSPEANHNILSFPELLEKYRKNAGGSKCSEVEEKYKALLKSKSEKAYSVHNTFVYKRMAMYATGAIAAGSATLFISPIAASAVAASSTLFVGHYAFTKLAGKKE